MSNFASFRMRKDIEKLVLDVKNIKMENNSVFFSLTFKNEFYNNIYSFECTFTDEYPFQSPKVYCLTPTFHPNIYAIPNVTPYKGSVCLKILRLGWMPSYDLNSIVVSIMEAFEDVSPEEPFDLEAANLFLLDKAAFKNKIKQVENI